MLVLATTPCGLGIAGCIPGRKRGGAQASSWPLVGLKLVGQPALTWVLAYKVFNLPTGTGPFMLAEYSNLEAGLISRTILLSPLAGDLDGVVVPAGLCGVAAGPFAGQPAPKGWQHG